MIPFSLSQIGSVLGGKLIGSDVSIEQVSTNSQAIPAKALFVALMGERFDGHIFTDKAKEAGALALLVSKPVETDLPQLIVADTKIALGQLGAWIKSQSNVKTYALTGSCGKTTVKEMLAAILRAKGKTRHTLGNFNNEIGVPLTLLRLTQDDDFAVIELGANHLGEIAYTTQLVKPDIALVTNLAAAHLEGFGSLSGVAKAKGEIFQGLKADGIAIVNLDSSGEEMWQAALENKHIVTISLCDSSADYFAKDIKLAEGGCFQFRMITPSSSMDMTLNLPGEHNITNALLAAAAALQDNRITLADVKQGLASVEPVKGRGLISYPLPHWRVIDDSYNASLAAMKAAVDLLDSFSGEKMIVLADMAEMGEHSDAVHQDVATYLAQSGIQTVFTYGPASQVISACCAGLHFDDKDALSAHVVNVMKTKHNVSVLVKGANGMKMWEVVHAIEEAASC